MGLRSFGEGMMKLDLDNDLTQGWDQGTSWLDRWERNDQKKKMEAAIPLQIEKMEKI